MKLDPHLFLSLPHPCPPSLFQSRQMTTTVRLIRITEYAGGQQWRGAYGFSIRDIHSYARARLSLSLSLSRRLSRMCVSPAFVCLDNALIPTVGWVKARGSIVTNAFNATLIERPRNAAIRRCLTFSVVRAIWLRWRFIELTVFLLIECGTSLYSIGISNHTHEIFSSKYFSSYFRMIIPLPYIR